MIPYESLIAFCNPSQFFILDIFRFICVKKVRLVQYKIEILPGLGYQFQKLVGGFVGVFFRGGDPDQDVQIFEEIENTLPVLSHEAVKIRQVTQEYVLYGLCPVSNFPPGNLFQT